MKTEQMLFLLLRSALGKALSPDESKNLKQYCDGAARRELFYLSARHDMVHMVARGLVQNGLMPREGKGAEKYENQQLHAVYRYENMQHELKALGELFGRFKIDYIPLKGAKISHFYPEPWMRTSCDIDVLVREDTLDRAAALLVGELGYTAEERRNFHDLALTSPTGVHVELHFSLAEPMEKMNAVLSRAWEYASPVAEDTCEHGLAGAFFLFHNIAHAAYHFVKGGCGIRPVLDIFLLYRALPHDREALHDLLKESDLTAFAKGITALGNVWFDGTEPDALCEKMEAYILRGGSFGLLDHRVAVEQLDSGSAARNLCRRIFMPYAELSTYYKGLAGKPWLTPAYQVRRWCRVAFGKGRAAALEELRSNAFLDEQIKNAAQSLCRELNLV